MAPYNPVVSKINTASIEFWAPVASDALHATTEGGL